jgi:Flp pilus assembly protein TadG
MTGDGAAPRPSRTGLVPACLRRVAGGRLAAPRSGQVLVMLGLMMMVLIGFVAIATDTGFIWMNRRSLQNAVDAAALAGVQSLPDLPATASTTACTYVTTNAVPNMTGANCTGKADVTLTNSNTKITVTAHKVIHPIFGVAVGFGNITISATATAVVGSITSACIFPLSQTQDLLVSGGVWGGSGVILNKATVMKIESSGGIPLRLQINGSSSASDFTSVIGSASGCPPGGARSVAGTTASLGAISGPVRQGLGARQTLWTSQGNCTSSNPSVYLRSDGNLWKYPLGTANNIQFTPATCYRMVKIPILDVNSAAMSNNTTYVIKAISIFYIGGWCDSGNNCVAPVPPFTAGTPNMQPGQIWGYYVALTGQADVYKDYDGFGTKVFALSN